MSAKLDLMQQVKFNFIKNNKKIRGKNVKNYFFCAWYCQTIVLAFRKNTRQTVRKGCLYFLVKNLKTIECFDPEKPKIF